MTVFSFFFRLREEYAFVDMLVAENRGKMLAVARSYLRNADFAEDAVHDAAMALMRNAAVLRRLQPKALQSYVISAVKTACLMINRKNRGAEFPDEWDEVWKDESPSAEEQILQKASLETLAKAIRTLNFEEQTLITMKYFEEYGDTEIARRLNAKPSTVRSKLCRIRAKLRNSLKEDCENEG